jgi:hypothetical protein
MSARIHARSSCSGPPPVGPGPPPARSSSISESSKQLPSITLRWPHPESREPGCATTWPAVRRRVALRSSIPGVACRDDGWLPSGGRARSESVSAPRAMVDWALSVGLQDIIDLPFSQLYRFRRMVANRFNASDKLADSVTRMFIETGSPI